MYFFFFYLIELPGSRLVPPEPPVSGVGDLDRPEGGRAPHPLRHVVLGSECGRLRSVPQIRLEGKTGEVGRLSVGRPRCHIEPQLEVVMVAGGFVTQQQWAVDVELDAKIKGEGWTSVRVQAMAVRTAPALRCIFG